jgi:hypothetical protein
MKICKGNLMGETSLEMILFPKIQMHGGSMIKKQLIIIE